MKTLYPVLSATALFRAPLKAVLFLAVIGSVSVPAALAGGRNSGLCAGGDPVLPEAMLPATLVNWALSWNSSAIQLRWTTTIEKNISHFIIERSFDGAYYADDAMIVAAGNSAVPTDYRYADKIPAGCNGVIYYRLKLVTMTGRVSISEVRVARVGNADEEKLQVSVYPNPVVNQLRVVLPRQWQNRPVTYQLVNAGGQVIRSYERRQTCTTEIISMSAVPAGMYHLRISNGSAVSMQAILKAAN